MFKYILLLSLLLNLSCQNSTSTAKLKNELEPPPIALKSEKAFEVMRVWAEPGKKQEVILNTTWEDPGAWGIMLVDIAKHASNAYSNEGRNKKETLKIIKAYFDKEWENATDEPEEIKPK